MTTTNILLAPGAAREGDTLRRLGRNEWPREWFTSTRRCPTLAAWLSREYMVQLFDDDGAFRMTVNRTRYQLVDGEACWIDGISWDDLQRIKGECGYGHCWAVEVYPPDADVVNVANMRHLWLLDKAPRYGWHT